MELGCVGHIIMVAYATVTNVVVSIFISSKHGSDDCVNNELKVAAS
jgi:hypothetical protein